MEGPRIFPNALFVWLGRTQKQGASSGFSRDFLPLAKGSFHGSPPPWSKDVIRTRPAEAKTCLFCTRPSRAGPSKSWVSWTPKEEQEARASPAFNIVRRRVGTLGPLHLAQQAAVLDAPVATMHLWHGTSQRPSPPRPVAYFQSANVTQQTVSGCVSWGTMSKQTNLTPTREVPSLDRFPYAQHTHTHTHTHTITYSCSLW